MSKAIKLKKTIKPETTTIRRNHMKTNKHNCFCSISNAILATAAIFGMVFLFNTDATARPRSRVAVQQQPVLSKYPIGTQATLQLQLPSRSSVLGITDDGFVLVAETTTFIRETVTLIIVKEGTPIPSQGASQYLGCFHRGGIVYAVFLPDSV
jgi:hypothetical protein